MSKKISGIVSSDKQDKTIVVTVTTRKTHPVYGKSYIVSKKFAAHDEKNEAKIGDKVIIAECKPISKHKAFTLDTIVERGREAVEIKKEMVEEEIEAKLAEKAAKRAELSSPRAEGGADAPASERNAGDPDKNSKQSGEKEVENEN